jgi:hypothetical protein
VRLGIISAPLEQDLTYSRVLGFGCVFGSTIYASKFMAPYHGIDKVEMVSFHSHHTERVVKNDFFLSLHFRVGQKGIRSEKLALARQSEIDSGCTGIALIIGGVGFECSVFSLESHNFFFLG